VLVVLEVILDAVINIRDLRDIKSFVLGAEILFNLAPTSSHQFPCFTMVQNSIFCLRVIFLDAHNIHESLN